MIKITQGRILRVLFNGGSIRVEFDHKTGVRSYRLVPGGHLLKESVVKRMLADCLIRPNKDGLFEEGPVQSYSLWRTSEGGA